MTPTLTMLITAPAEEQAFRLEHCAIGPERAEMFDQAAIKEVYRLLRRMVLEDLEQASYPNVQEILWEWSFIVTGQGQVEGLGECRHLEELNELRIKHAKGRDLDSDAAWTEIIAAELEYFDDAIALGLEHNLPWSEVERTAARIKHAKICERNRVDPETSPFDLAEVLETTNKALREEIVKVELERAKVFEQYRALLGLPVGTPLEEIRAKANAIILRLRVRKAQAQNQPPDDLIQS